MVLNLAYDAQQSARSRVRLFPMMFHLLSAQPTSIMNDRFMGRLSRACSQFPVQAMGLLTNESRELWARASTITFHADDATQSSLHPQHRRPPPRREAASTAGRLRLHRWRGGCGVDH